jgi:hypothetical protein
MICPDCKWDPNKPEIKAHHENCKSRNEGKVPPDCDCQHRE